MAGGADPARIYPHLQAIYDEYHLVHSASGQVMADALNVLSRKIEADKAFLDAFRSLEVVTGHSGAEAAPLPGVPTSPPVASGPPPLPPHWAPLDEGQDGGDLDEWRSEMTRRRLDALKREVE